MTGAASTTTTSTRFARAPKSEPLVEHVQRSMEEVPELGGDRARRDRGVAVALGAAGPSRPTHHCWRQGLRHEEIRGLDARYKRHSSRGPEPVPRAVVGARRPDHQARWIYRQPAEPKVRRGGLRLDQDGRELQTDEIQGSGADQHGEGSGVPADCRGTWIISITYKVGIDRSVGVWLMEA
jgi:hypothetical protein